MRATGLSMGHSGFPTRPHAPRRPWGVRPWLWGVSVGLHVALGLALRGAAVAPRVEMATAPPLDDVAVFEVVETPAPPTFEAPPRAALVASPRPVRGGSPAGTLPEAASTTATSSDPSWHLQQGGASLGPLPPRWNALPQSDHPLDQRAQNEELAKTLSRRMAAELDAADNARGTGRAGPLVATLVGLADRSTALGQAEFWVTIGKDGALDVQSAQRTGDIAAWQALAESLRAETSALLKIRVPASANGLRFVLSVSAKAECPDGSSVSPSQGKCSAVGGPNLAGDPASGNLVAGISFSPENAAVSAVRRVRVHLVDETRLY